MFTSKKIESAIQHVTSPTTEPAYANLCPHFGECGGCASQDVPYEAQVGAKAAKLEYLFREFWGKPVPVTPSPVIWHYRNKVDFNFARKRYVKPPPSGFERETVLGFTRKGAWYWPLNVHECRIGPVWAKPLLDAVRNWTRAERLHAYDQRSKLGLLRVLLVREAKHTGEGMVVLITRSGDVPVGSFVDSVLSAHPAASIYRAIYDGTAQGVFADELQLLHGAPEIHEELHIPTGGGDTRNLHFRISPLSFFQTNTFATELLYGAIRRWAEDIRPAVLYDLYGGAGGIAFTCADLAQIVRSVESAPEATQDGRANAAANKIDNVFFETAIVKNYLRWLLDSGDMERDAAVVVDPPRAGLHPKVVKRLVALAPYELLYVSCNPAQLAQEMPVLAEGFDLVDLKAIDLFPHTPHVEAIARFRRRSA